MSSRAKRRPFKVWSCDRKLRKAVVVASLQELKEKSSEKLGYEFSEGLKVALESDGTEIEDDSYFRTIKEDTILLLIRPGESWQSSDAENVTVRPDETDNPTGMFSASEMNGLSLLNFVKSDVANLLMLSRAQMEQVAAVDVETSFVGNQFERRTVEAIQETCDRILTENQEQAEWLDVLRRLEVHLCADSVDSSSVAPSQPVFENVSELRNLLRQVRTVSREAEEQRSDSQLTNPSSKRTRRK